VGAAPEAVRCPLRLRTLAPRRALGGHSSSKSGGERGESEGPWRLQRACVRLRQVCEVEVAGQRAGQAATGRAACVWPAPGWSVGSRVVPGRSASLLGNLTVCAPEFWCCRPCSAQVTLAGVIYCFDRFQLDTETYELREAGESLPIQRKVFDVLCYLVEHRNRVVGKDELLAAVWPKEFVVDSAVHRVISHLRRALHQDGRNAPIETVHGRGYRFRADVSCVVPESGAETEPVEAEVTDSSTRTLPELAFASEPEPFVGREELFATLANGLAEASARRGRMFLITGESGIGKTHAIETFLQSVQPQGVIWWKARCSNFEGVPVFWPWIQLVRGSLRHVPSGSVLERRGEQLLSELVPKLGEAAPVMMHRQEAAGARFMLLDELSQFFIDACDAKGGGGRSDASCGGVRVLWLDDLSPQDSDSLRVLHLLSAAIESLPLIVIATLRGCGGSLGSGESGLGIPDSMQCIPLSVLSEEEVEEYVARFTRVSDPRALARWLCHKTGGNPLFIREMLRYLSGSGAHRLDDIASLDAFPLPAVVQEVVGRRLATIPGTVRELLELAAVIGESVSLAALQRASQLDGAQLLEVLDEAESLGLLVRDSSSRTYGFVHGVIRDALYQGLDSNEVAQLHLKVALALEEHAVDGVELSELAYHFYRSLPYGSPRLAQRYAVQAARAAGRATAYADAARFIGWALEAQSFEGVLDPHKRCRFLLSAAMSEHAAGHEPAARSLVADLVELAIRHRYGDMLAVGAMILRPLSIAMTSEPDPLARRALEAALEWIPKLPKRYRPLRSRVLSLLSWLPPFADDRVKRLEMSSEARRLASDADPRSEFEALFARHLALCAPEDLEQALKLSEELLELCRREPASISALEAHLCLLHTFLRSGESDRALRELQAFGTLAHEWSFPSSIWIHDRLSLQQSFYSAEFDLALAGVCELYQRGHRQRLRFDASFAHVLCDRIEREWGRPVELDWLPTAPRAGFSAKTPAQQAREIRRAAEEGRAAFARSELSRMGRSGFRDVPRDGVLLATLSELSLAAVALDAKDQVEQLFLLLEPFADHNALDEFWFSWGAVGYYVGRLAETLGEFETAANHLQRAVELNLRLGHRPQAARARLALGQVLLRGSDETTRERGVELLRGVHADARELGLRATQNQTEQALFKAGPPRSP